jgi:DNA ligase-1
MEVKRIFDGELYCHGMDFEDINGIVSRTVNLHDDYEKIEYHIFDYISEDASQMSRIINLQRFKQELPEDFPIKVVKSRLAYDFDQVYGQYKQYLKEGYEGIIVRNIDGTYVERRSTNVMKFKPKKSDSYKVVGYQEEVHGETGEPKGRLGALVCDDTCGGTFNVGSGFTAHQRKLFWDIREQLAGMTVLIEYQHITKDQKPRFPIFMRLIKSDADYVASKYIDDEVAVRGED